VSGVVHTSVSTWRQPTPAGASAQRRALIDEVAADLLARGAGRLRVAVDGLTAAGKTSFGHELADALSRVGRPVLRASLDDFKRPWAERHRYDRESGSGYYRNAFDYDALSRLLLEPFAAADAAGCALCSIDPLTQVDHSTERTPVEPTAVLVVDGVFALRRELDRHWDYRIWLDVPEDASLSRGRARDGAVAGHLHETRYLPAERLYLAEADPMQRADAVIDNADFDRPRLR
jgi:uridine kinase